MPFRAFQPKDRRNLSRSSTKVVSVTKISIYRSRPPRVAARRARTSHSRQKRSAVNAPFDTLNATPDDRDPIAMAYELVPGYVAGGAATQACLATAADMSWLW